MRVPLDPHAGGVLVLGEVGLEGKGLAAAGTHKGLGVGVCLLVGPHVGLVRKGLRADATSVWLLT